MYIPDWWVWLIVNPVPTDFTFVWVMTHTAVLVIQDGQTALDMAREEKDEFTDEDTKAEYDKLIDYLESVGK